MRAATTRASYSGSIRTLLVCASPRVRPTTAAHGGACAEGKTGYASYCSVEDSAEDIVRWLEFNSVDKNIRSIDQFVKVLKKKKYFTDKESKYLRSLKKIHSDQKRTV
jgi:hypothetical protein